MNIVEYAASIFFFFYLLNYSDIAEPFRKNLYSKIDENISYALSCAYCSTFWVTVVLVFFHIYPLYFLFVAPVINLFLIKIFDFLNK